MNTPTIIFKLKGIQPWKIQFNNVFIFQHELRDFRTYHTYEYVPKSPNQQRNESSDEDSDDEDGQRLVRAVNDDPNDSIINHFKMRKATITEPGAYRLGYYSKKMSCLVAVSEPFEVKRTVNSKP